MFTGIIREIGRIKRIRQNGYALSLEISAKDTADTVKIGDSVSVNGVCLTAVKSGSGILNFDVMAETVRRSTFPGMKEGDKVNLESAMRSDGTFDGHFVQGHVDCVGIVRTCRKGADGFSMEIKVPAGFDGLYVDKGSIALDGVSLTIGRVRNGGFDVYIIPHTLEETTLGFRRAGDSINIEFDVIGKYVARMQAAGKNSQVTEEFLEEKGFI